MIPQTIIEFTGKIKEISPYHRGKILYSEKGNFYLSNRDPELSDARAIEMISTYGIIPITVIGTDFILQKYIEFDKEKKLSPDQSVLLLKKIHKNHHNGMPLVHGDFGGHNTVLFNDKPCCYDFEYTHFGDVYLDIGRVILRECLNEESFNEFSKEYFSDFPRLDEFRDGLMRFCDWQNKLRLKKGLGYAEVPLIRKERLKNSQKNLKSILESFQNV